MLINRYYHWENSGGSRNPGMGGGGPGTIEFLGSENGLMPFPRYSLFFVVRVEDKIDIVNTAC